MGLFDAYVDVMGFVRLRMEDGSTIETRTPVSAYTEVRDAAAHTANGRPRKGEGDVLMSNATRESLASLERIDLGSPPKKPKRRERAARSWPCEAMIHEPWNKHYFKDAQRSEMPREHLCQKRSYQPGVGLCRKHYDDLIDAYDEWEARER